MDKGISKLCIEYTMETFTKYALGKCTAIAVIYQICILVGVPFLFEKNSFIHKK